MAKVEAGIGRKLELGTTAISQNWFCGHVDLNDRFYLGDAVAYNDSSTRQPNSAYYHEKKMDSMDIENLGGLTTVWSIRIAMGCLFCSFFLRLINRPTTSPKSSGNAVADSMVLIGSRNLWLLGSFFSLMHAMAAMIFYHHGSHALAFADTARQTQALLGISVGMGIYFNYAFVLIWLADAMWWIARPEAYQTRARFFNWLIYGFLIFIVINGTIVFESGIVRWASVAGFALLLGLAFRQGFFKKQVEQ